MADRGTIHVDNVAEETQSAFRGFGSLRYLLNAAQNAADGSISALVLFHDDRGTLIARRFADGTGTWTLRDLPPGTFYAREVGSARNWQISITAANVVTVTQLFATNGGSVGYAG